MGRYSYSQPSSSSPESIRSVDQFMENHGIPKLCICGRRIVLQQTRSDAVTPNRLYYGCENYDDDEYHTHKWWDEAMTDELEDVQKLVSANEALIQGMNRNDNGENVDPPVMWSRVMMHDGDIDHLKIMVDNNDAQINELTLVVHELMAELRLKRSTMSTSLKSVLLIMSTIAVVLCSLFCLVPRD